MKKRRKPAHVGIESQNLFAVDENPVVAGAAHKAIDSLVAIAEQRMREIQRQMWELVEMYETTARSNSRALKYFRRLKLQISPAPGVERPLVYLRWRIENYEKFRNEEGKQVSTLVTDTVAKKHKDLFVNASELGKNCRKEEKALVEFAEKFRAMYWFEHRRWNQLVGFANKLRADLQNAQLQCITFSVEKKQRRHLKPQRPELSHEVDDEQTQAEHAFDE